MHVQCIEYVYADLMQEMVLNEMQRKNPTRTVVEINITKRECPAIKHSLFLTPDVRSIKKALPKLTRWNVATYKGMLKYGDWTRESLWKRIMWTRASAIPI